MRLIPRLLMVTNATSPQWKFPIKTLSFKGEDTFNKENYMLSRKRVAVLTQISSNKNIKLNPQFVFKGKGKRIKVAAPDRVNYHWPVSGSN